MSPTHSISPAWNRAGLLKSLVLLVTAATIGSSLLRLGTMRSAKADPPAGATAPGEGKPYTEQIPGTDVKFDMVPIPGGKFKMGSPVTEPKRKDDEGPQFDVQVEPFWMGKYVVTWDQYNLFLQNYDRRANEKAPPKIPTDQEADAVTYPTPLYELDAGPKLNRMGRGSEYPAVIMSQFAARQFTKWLSKKTGHFYRLPTEAEWEYACRAGTTTAYSFGDDPKALKDYGWNIDDSALSDGDTGYHQVGLKKPNAWGLYDMHGNVAEWCMDQYDPKWYKQFEGKTVTAAEAIDWPKGAKNQYSRVIRGGGYDSEAEECRSASRYGSEPKLNIQDPQLPKSPHWITEGLWIGFRVIAPVKPPPESEQNKWWNADDTSTIDTIKRDREQHEIVEPGPDKPAKK